MANIISTGTSIDGTADADIIAAVNDGTTPNTAINAGDGNDLILGDHANMFVDSTAANASAATAINIDDASRWSTLPGVEIGDSSVPYTSIVAQGAGAFDWYSITLAAGQTIALDLDFGFSTPQYGGPNIDSEIKLLAPDGTTVLTASDDESAAFGGIGTQSFSDTNIGFDSGLIYTATTAGTYYFRVEQFDDAPIDAGVTYLLNVSVTGHAATSTATGGNDTVGGQNGDDFILGGAGDDFLVGGTGSDTVYGGDGGNIYIDEEDGADDFFYGGASLDDYAVAANSGHLAVVDAGGTNSVQALLSSVGWTINAQTGTGSSTGSTLSFTGGLFNNLYGSNFDDVITAGTNVSSSLVGNDGNDTITGSKLNDFIRGGAGDDVMNGGAGIDIAAYDNAASAVTVSLAITTQQDTQGGGLDSLTSFETLVGSAFNDTLTGSSIANRIEGGDGDDTIEGLGGNDVLIGGNNTVVIDTLSGDTISYEHAAARVVVSLANTAAQNTLGAGVDTIEGFENLKGSAFNDTLTGDGGPNSLIGLGGNDILIGGLGDDILNGGDGVDVASYATAAAGVVVNLNLSGVFQSTFGAGDDALVNIEGLIGSNFNDTLVGNGGNNSLAGGLGNDLIVGDLGNDGIDGGAGIDTLDYSGIGAAVTVNLVSQSAQNSGGAGSDTIRNIENVIGTAFNDALTGNEFGNVLTGGVGNDVLIGNLGNDTLNGGDGIDTANYGAATAGVKVNLTIATAQTTVGAGSDTLSGIENLNGSGFDDIFTGDNADNVLTGNGGNDTLIGGGGNDMLTGGQGIDTIGYATATSAVTVNLLVTAAQNTGGAGSDTIASAENLTGSNFDDVLTGNAQLNTLIGGTGNDTLDGGSANDVLDGGSGNDILKGSNGDDRITAGAGNDNIDGGTGIDTLQFGATAAGVTVNLLLTGPQAMGGGQGTDTIVDVENVTGTNFGDTLMGYGAENVLDGGGGNDIIFGGPNRDTLTGGTGNDNFRYTFHSDSLVGFADRITDFASGDILDLSGVDANANTTGTNEAFTQVAAFTGVAGQLTLAFDAGSNTTTLLADLDGNGSGEFSILFTGDVSAAITANWVP